MKTALIILVHDSVPNTVKTGSITHISEQESAAIRRQLLAHTQRVTINLHTDKFVFLPTTHDASQDIWRTTSFIKRMQRGRATGEIMQHAFENVFGFGV